MLLPPGSPPQPAPLLGSCLDPPNLEEGWLLAGAHGHLLERRQPSERTASPVATPFWPPGAQEGSIQHFAKAKGKGNPAAFQQASPCEQGTA